VTAAGGPAFRPLFDAHVELAGIRSLGRTPLGERRIIDILGGSFRGERLAGRILPGGADWQIVRADGAADLDARYTLEADGGALIQVRSRGLRHGPADVLARLAAGEPVDAGAYYFRTALRFETGAGEIDWLNRIIAIGIGVRLPRAVQLRVFEVL
jgi:uncharacterized protein DUF3237